MRPQQHGRRQRNRGNNNNNRNRNQNPLARSYESNGPDVKIRGNAQQVADKYEAMARDAQSAGDRVMAENYLQHAEHYKRIIMAYQQAQAQEREEREQRSADEEQKADTDQATAQPSGNDEQPVLSETPEEVKQEEADVVANAKPARQRRTRRPKQTGEEEREANATAETADTDGEAPKKTRTRRTKKVETASVDNEAPATADALVDQPDEQPVLDM